MKKYFVSVGFLLFFYIAYCESIDHFKFKPVERYLKYVEDFFRLYNEWLYQDLDNISRNIYFLEMAWVLPFDHPVRALTPIKDETHWQRYKYLLKMHIALLLTKGYLEFGKQYFKENIYFYNEEYKKELLDGYDVAEIYFKSSFAWLKEAERYARLASKFDPMVLSTTLYFAEDAYKKLLNGEIYYKRTIQRLLKEINENRRKLKSLKPFEWVEPIP